MNTYAGVLSAERLGVQGTEREAQLAHTPHPTPHASHQLASYYSAQVLGASPIQLILMIYDVAIVACGRRDTDRARRAVCELIAALNFDYEISVPLFRLYEYCLHQIATGSYDEASKTLRGLKQAWEAALQQHGAGKAYDGLR